MTRREHERAVQELRARLAVLEAALAYCARPIRPGDFVVPPAPVRKGGGL